MIPLPSREGDTSHPSDAASVRPYAVTGGRTRSGGDVLALETLVSAVPSTALTGAGAHAERRRILELTAGTYLSIAELSAHLGLPVGVVRVVVGDMAADGLLRVHTPAGTDRNSDPATPLSVLESVLDGIAAL